MRLWLLSLLAFGSVVTIDSARALDLIEKTDIPDSADEADKKYVDDKQKAVDKLISDRKVMEDQLAGKIKEIEGRRQELAKKGTANVTLDEETRDVTEPSNMEEALNMQAPRRVRDEYEISPDDFQIDIHDRWSLNATDFKIDQPVYLTGNVRKDSAKTWFVIPFQTTNSTTKKRRISPVFVAVTNSPNKKVFLQSGTGFVPERLLADNMMRPLGASEAIGDKELLSQRVSPLESSVLLGNFALDPEKGTHQLSPQATFEPGQTRNGAAVWSTFTNEWTELKVVVHGLSNSHRYEEKMRRVLILTFNRNDDEFDVHRSLIKYADKRFDFIWAWDQDITVPLPGEAKDPQIKVAQIQTPAGGSKTVWAFPFQIRNSSRTTQEIAINSIAYAAPMEIDVGGAKVALEVKIIDDGRSSIYKAQHLKALGKDSAKDRFIFKPVAEGSMTLTQRRTIGLEVAKELPETWAVFDEADVDWDDVRVQVESALTEKLDKKAAAAANWERVVKQVAPNDPDLLKKNPGILYDPRRRLTDEEFAQVKEQVTKGIPAALDAAKGKKIVRAWFNCTAGLASGEYRITRTYRKPGVVEEAWLTEWDTWFKGFEAGNLQENK